MGGVGFVTTFGPDKERCVSLWKSEEGVVIAEIDLSMIGFAKQGFLILRAARTYHD